MSSHGSYQLNLVSADGGSAEELLPLPDYVDYASWSADGQALLFANSPPWGSATSPDAGLCALDLRTRQVSRLPGGEGLITPQPSPDGRFVVAGLAHDEKKLVLYDLGTHKKSDLAKSESEVVVMGWSRNGESYYFAIQNETNVVVRRVRIKSRRVELVGDLKDLRLVNGANGYWLGLGPDDSPLFLRDVGTQDIYALDVDFP